MIVGGINIIPGLHEKILFPTDDSSQLTYIQSYCYTQAKVLFVHLLFIFVHRVFVLLSFSLFDEMDVLVDCSNLQFEQFTNSPGG